MVYSVHCESCSTSLLVWPATVGPIFVATVSVMITSRCATLHVPTACTPQAFDTATKALHAHRLRLALECCESHQLKRAKQVPNLADLA